MTKQWPDYIDQYDLVVQKKSLGADGGDSLNRTMAATVLTFLATGEIQTLRLKSRLRLLISSKCKVRRHADYNKWYSAWDRGSRDQYTPLIILMGLIPRGDGVLKRLFLDHLKRGLLFTTNTRRNYMYASLEEQEAKMPYATTGVVWDYSWKLPDLTGPEYWALYIRGFKAKWMWPLLWLFDLQTLIGALVLRYQSTDDVINHALTLEYAKVRMDTWWMKLARKITSREWLQMRLDSFFEKELEPPINELFRELR